jgi:hypothetical protein
MIMASEYTNVLKLAEQFWKTCRSKMLSFSVWVKMWLAMQVARPGCTDDDKLVSVTLVRHLSV